MREIDERMKIRKGSNILNSLKQQTHKMKKGERKEQKIFESTRKKNYRN
jgi:hypothetical protein